MDKVFVLYNPLSNNKQGFEDSQALKATAYDKDLEYVDITKISNYKNFFNSLKEDEQVIICGGDGTLNRFINSIDGLSIKNEVFHMPTGTGNDFFKDVNGGSSVPVKINDYIKDLPICEIKGQSYKFINGVGYGIDGYCCEVGDEQKKISDKPVNYIQPPLQPSSPHSPYSL